MIDAQQPISNKHTSKTRGRLLYEFLVFTLAFSFIVYFFYTYYPGSDDYARINRQVSGRWFYGYDTELYTDGFYLAPWSLAYLLPLLALPVRVANTVVNSSSLLLLFLSTNIFTYKKSIPLYGVIFAIVNIGVADLFVRGQVEGLILIGLAMAWYGTLEERPWLVGWGFWLVSFKPTQSILAVIVIIMTLRHWPRDSWVKIVTPLLVSFIISLFMLGIQWPLDYVEYLRNDPLPNPFSIDMWTWAEHFGLPSALLIIPTLIAVAMALKLAYTEGLTLRVLAIALATNLSFFPYVSTNHLVLLIPGIVYLAQYNGRLALYAYLSSMTVINRWFFDVDHLWIEISYPLTVLALCWYLKPSEAEELAPAESTSIGLVEAMEM
jgi:hypothetical protein